MHSPHTMCILCPPPHTARATHTRRTPHPRLTLSVSSSVFTTRVGNARNGELRMIHPRTAPAIACSPPRPALNQLNAVQIARTPDSAEGEAGSSNTTSVLMSSRASRALTIQHSAEAARHRTHTHESGHDLAERSPRGRDRQSPTHATPPPQIEPNVHPGR